VGMAKNVWRSRSTMALHEHILRVSKPPPPPTTPRVHHSRHRGGALVSPQQTNCDSRIVWCTSATVPAVILSRGRLDARAYPEPVQHIVDSVLRQHVRYCSVGRSKHCASVQRHVASGWCEQPRHCLRYWGVVASNLFDVVAGVSALGERVVGRVAVELALRGLPPTQRVEQHLRSCRVRKTRLHTSNTGKDWSSRPLNYVEMPKENVNSAATRCTRTKCQPHRNRVC
jgi:hypothetical protein